MSDIRNLLARAQESETRGNKAEAAEWLRKAAAWYRDRQQLRRAAQMLRQARRVEGIDDEEDLAPAVSLPEDDAAPLPMKAVEEVETDGDQFGFGEDFAGDAGRVLVEKRTPQLADPSSDAWCSFCCRPKDEVGPLVQGPAGAFICAGCTALSASLRGAQVSAAPREEKILLQALGFELPAQRRARERFLRHRARLALVVGPAGSGKSAFLSSVAHADHRVFDASARVDESEVLSWLEGAGRSVSLVLTSAAPTPVLVLEGEHGPEPLHDTATLVASLPAVPASLAQRIDAVHAFEAPDDAALLGLARHLAQQRKLEAPDAVLARIVELAQKARRGAHELVTLLARIPPGTYR